MKRVQIQVCVCELLNWMWLIPSCHHSPLFFPSLCPGCSYQAGGQSSAPAHDGSGPLVPEPTHGVHCRRPDRVETDGRRLRHLRVERDHRVLHRRWVTCSLQCCDDCVHFHRLHLTSWATGPTALRASTERNTRKWRDGAQYEGEY